MEYFNCLNSKTTNDARCICGTESRITRAKSVIQDEEQSCHKQIQGDTKKREILKNPTKTEEIQEKNLLTEIELAF